MFLYTTNRKFHGRLELTQLIASNRAWLEQAAEWTENKWGYLRDYPGIEARKELVRNFVNNPKNKFFIVTYAKQPVGMFAFADHPVDLLPTEVVKELTYFYVEVSFRSMGLGSSMLAQAKKKAKELGVDMLVFDTLNPYLNRFYEKNQGREIAESRLLGAPTTLFRMDVETELSDEEMANSVFAESATAKRLGRRF